MKAISRQILVYATRRHRRWFIAITTLLGAILGTSLAKSHVAACDCVELQWQLELDQTTEMDETVWPTRARLRATSSPQVILDSLSSDFKVDHVMGGSW